MRLLRFFFSNSFTSLFFLNSSQNCIRSSAILFLRQALLIDCVLSLTQLLLCIQPPKDDIHSLSMIAVVHTILCWFCIDIIDRNTCTKSPQTARNNDTIAFESSSILSSDRQNWTLCAEPTNLLSDIGSCCGRSGGYIERTLGNFLSLAASFAPGLIWTSDNVKAVAEANAFDAKQL